MSSTRNELGNQHSHHSSANTDSVTTRRRFLQLSLAALGVVFGDIATSPIYAIRECFHGDYGISVSQENIFGVLSLIFWTLILIVGIKYMVFVFRANNRGEGGVIALTALLLAKSSTKKAPRLGIVALGIFAACLLYGDGMITPAISVLSAVEGASLIAPVCSVYVLPLTIIILICLFFLQRHGTSRIGCMFGPIILLWVSFLAVIGVFHIMHNPGILAAMLPWHAANFLILNKLHGFIVLGAVFLVVTGTEALYADMGHFGAQPIRMTWLYLVFPALLLNYFGQGALLLVSPELAEHPFFSMIPGWALIPSVVLATLATIIASQAVISGAFSLTRQAIQLGYFPRLKISHTSSTQIGQIYIGPINWMLMVCTISLVLIFKASGFLAAAYGVAVTSTMLVTSILFYNIARRHWKWPVLGTSLLLALFIVIDLSFFCANISKVFHGAWLPLLIGAVFFMIMWTWKNGRLQLSRKISDLTVSIEQFQQDLVSSPPKMIDGCAIFLSGNADVIPFALIQNIKHNRVLHDKTVVLHFLVEDVPRILDSEKIRIDKLGDGLYRVIASNGFMEDVEIQQTLALANCKGLDVDLKTASYFLGRERLTLGTHPNLNRWISILFMLISRNTSDVSSFFHIPTNQVIEVGVQLEL